MLRILEQKRQVLRFLKINLKEKKKKSFIFIRLFNERIDEGYNEVCC